MATIEGSRDRKALVLYGTESGNAQDVAEEIERMTERLRFTTTVAEFDAVSLDALSNNIICVFVVSTTGQGEFPSNARRLWASLLKKKLSSSYLAHVDFAVIGLGDSSYPKFNFAARKLQKRLRQLGAREICDSCEADEQGEEGTDGSFLSWLPGFRSTLLEYFPLPAGVGPLQEDVPLAPKWRAELLDKPRTILHASESKAQVPLHLNGISLSLEQSQQSQVIQNGIQSFESSISSSSSLPKVKRLIPQDHHATLTTNQRLTPQNHWQDVRLLTITISEEIHYFPGDALAITPKNRPSDVSTLVELMSWESVADLAVKVFPTSPSSTVIPSLVSTSPVTLRNLILNHLDILAIPRRSFFSRIAACTTDAFHKERLLEFADPKYLDEYYDYATRPRRSILEVLAEFDSVKIPWQDAVNVFPTLRPRQFSIASGGRLKQLSGSGNDGQGTRFELLIAIVRYRTVIRKIREGVCTRYLANLVPGSTLDVTLRTEGRFHGSPSPSLNHLPYRVEGLEAAHILIGTGTGLAPLRALIHEKKFLAEQGHVVGPTTLFFGCRSPDADFFFRNEDFATFTSFPSSDAETATATNISGFHHDFHLITAFSRYGKEKKVYVQDRIREHQEWVFKQIHRQNATVIVCGSSGAMPRAVREVLGDVISSNGLKREGEGMEEEAGDGEEGRRYLAEMEKRGRLREETW